MYSLQAQYLSRNPGLSSRTSCGWIAIAGILGYAIFRSANDQRRRFRATKGRCRLFGDKPEYIRAIFQTADGRWHESQLLMSGWWGIARHINYTGDILLSLAMCAPCGFRHLLPWSYAIYMAGLLVQRCFRDEDRCSAKYGESWGEYCQRVPWRLVPGIF